ncbi:MAG: RHS repeat-associated core domain-containing protein [Paludibacteraceae bacterium]
MTSEYNSFGRKTKETQPNGAATTYKTGWSNARPNAVYKSTAQSLNISQTVITYYDKFGREVYGTATGWKGQLIATSKKYNAVTGLLEKEVHPHYEGELEKYTAYVYGDFVRRLTTETFFDGVNSLTTTYLYPYNSRSTTVKAPNGQTKTTVTDASGLVISVTDGGGTIEYKDFNASGQPQTITANGAATTIAYDEMGRKQWLTDPNAGTITYTYYADGQLDTQTSAKGDLTKMVYDDAGRVQTKTITNTNGQTPTLNITTYTYVPNGENGVGQVQKIEQTLDGALSHKQEFTYNAHHQIATATETYDGQTVSTAYGYDNLWRPTTTTTPSGLVTTDVYDNYGDVYQVKAGENTIWEGKEQNSSGQWLKYTLGNGLQTGKTYSNRQELETIKTGIENNGTLTPTIQNVAYGYDAPTGNLLTRKDMLNNRNEVFTYDALDRLLTTQLTGSVIYSQTMTYQPNGNITTKSDVGTYRYNTPRPNAMSGISGVQAGVSTDKQFITYTTFNKVSEIRQGVDEEHITEQYNIYYGLDEQRIKTVYTRYTEDGETGQTRYYFGAYEKTYKANNIIEDIDYIYTPAGLTAIARYNDTEGVRQTYYVHTDRLGSIEALTDHRGGIVKKYAYTPWGGRIMLYGNDFDITDRGYTGHEHIFAPNNSTDGFGLINMNGRVYDPVLARFLSPDPYISFPNFSQSYNRYSYVLNNPFRFTDPSGENPIIIAAIIIGAYLGGSSVNGTFNPVKWNYNNWQTYAGIAVGGVAGWAGAAVGAGVAASAIAGGSSTIGAGIAGGMVGGMVSGGINGAGMTAVMGGSLDDVMANMTKGMVMGGFSGAISGGVGAAIGDFSGVSGSAFKNGVYELGHSALKGAATGLAGGAMMAAMEQDASYLWKGAAMGAALSVGMAGVRIGLMGSTILPSGARERFAADDAAFGIKNDYPIYRRGGLLRYFTPGITLGRNMMVDTRYMKSDPAWYDEALAHERAHIYQQKIMGSFNFYKRTLYEYLINPGYSNNPYSNPNCLEILGRPIYAFNAINLKL